MPYRLGNPVLGILILAIVLVAIVVGMAAVLRIDLWGERGSGLPSRFSYDLEAFQKTDPAQIGYRETGRIDLKLLEPRNLAVGPDDKIYVVGDRALCTFAPDGHRVRLVELENSPRAVAIGPSHKTPGRIYVAMKDHVEVFDAEGARQTVWESLDERALLTSIAAAESDVYVANAGGRVVLRYDLQGKLINRIGDRDDLRHIPGFIIPSPFFVVAVAPDGLLRVTNPGGHRVEAYTPEGLDRHPGLLRLLQPRGARHLTQRKRRYGRKGHSAGKGLQRRRGVRLRGGRSGIAAADTHGQRGDPYRAQAQSGRPGRRQPRSGVDSRPGFPQRADLRSHAGKKGKSWRIKIKTSIGGRSSATRCE
jgi:hypothetical protein